MSGFRLEVPPDLKPIQLVRKPKHSQGQLEVTDEGIGILQNLTAPFAIISAVGPTRTGKSSLLGRAFLNSPDFFEVGTGVHSHTTGIWMTNKPVSVKIKGVGHVQVLVVDTEGFHGVQERTSRTYENNLFALSYLLSSVLIYNSAYPVDSHHIDEIKGYAKTATETHASLERQGVHVTRNRPDLLWAVQNFNFYNLNNSGMTGESLMGNLTDTQMLGSLGMADEHLENLHGMFRSKSMAPIHRPHDDDEVLANLGAHDDAELRAEYTADLKRLRDKVYGSLKPMQVEGRPVSGKDFALNIERWVLYGHINIAEDQEGVHFVDKRMQGHVQEVMAEYERETKEMERRLNETVRAVPMTEFRKGLESLQASARNKLASRAMFWNYTLAKSPLEKHLGVAIDARAKELTRLYTGAALLRLSAAAARSKVDFMAGLKSTRPRDYLKEAVAQAISKKPPKANAPDYKALTAAVHGLVRAGDQAVTREARFAELERDRIGAQYLEEHRRWLGALEDVVLFAHKTVRKAAESIASSCSESKLRDVGVETFRERCGLGVVEGVERALRDRAAQALPAGDAAEAEAEENGSSDESDAKTAGTDEDEENDEEKDEKDRRTGTSRDDPDLAALVKTLLSAQRAAFAPALAGAVSAFSKASGRALERMAGAALESAEARLGEARAGAYMSGAGLEARLGQVEAEAEAAMREDMARLGMEPDEATGDCPIDAKGESVVRCGEYLEGLRAEVAKRAEEVRAYRRSSLKTAAIGFVALGLVGTAGAVRVARRERKAAAALAKKQVAV